MFKMLLKISKRFSPTIGMTLLALAGIIFFCVLGGWQLHRFTVKKDIINLQNQLQHSKPIKWFGETKIFPTFTPISTEGEFLDFVFLLDNQHNNHKFGYNVYSALLIKNNNVVLIDRGFIEAPRERHVFPEIKIPTGILNISGYVYNPSGKNFVLGNIIDRKKNKMYVVEAVDTKVISQILQKNVYPFIIRLDIDSPNGYLRQWSTVSMPPQRHLGYAVQWFALALCTLVIFIGLNIRNEKKR